VKQRYEGELVSRSTSSIKLNLFYRIKILPIEEKSEVMCMTSGQRFVIGEKLGNKAKRM